MNHRLLAWLRKRRCDMLFVGLLLFGLVGAIVVLCYPTTVESGRVSRITAVPVVGRSLAPLETTGQHVAYVCRYSYRDFTCFVSAKTSRACVQRFVSGMRRPRVYSEQDPPFEAASWIAEYGVDPTPLVTDFRERHTLASGYVHGLGFVQLRYRPSDGAFLLVATRRR